MRDVDGIDGMDEDLMFMELCGGRRKESRKKRRGEERRFEFGGARKEDERKRSRLRIIGSCFSLSPGCCCCFSWPGLNSTR